MALTSRQLQHCNIKRSSKFNDDNRENNAKSFKLFVSHRALSNHISKSYKC